MPSEEKILKRLAKLLKYGKKRRHRRRRSRTRSRSPRRPSSSDSEKSENYRTRTPSLTPTPERQNTSEKSSLMDLTEQEDVENTQETDTDHLAPFREALGHEYEVSVKFEGEIQEEISKRWDHILINGLTREERDDIIKKYRLPGNCKLLDAPILNEEIKTILTESSKIRDKSLENTQHQLGLATAILGRVMTDLIQEPDVDKVMVIKKLSDSAKLLNDLHHHKTKTRKLLISPLLDRNFINLVEKVNRDEHLYGMDLATKIKTSQEIKKSSSTIKKNMPRVTSNKNVFKQRTTGNRQGPPQNQPRQHTRTPAARGGLKNRMTQPSFHRSGPNQFRPREGCTTPCTQQAVDNQDKTPIEQSPFPGSEHLLREAFRRRSLPESSLNIMLASVSSGTMKQYSTVYKNWWLFCKTHGLEPTLTSVPFIIKFLTEKFENGASYNTLNSYKSALSLLMGEKVGTDDRVKRFLRGVFRLKPAMARYTETWNPSTVLNHLIKLPQNTELSLDILTKKLVTLLALATAQRVQTLSAIKLEDITITSARIIISVSDIVKTSVSTKKQALMDLPFYHQEPKLCPASSPDYIQRTAKIRHQEKYLIITYKKPYHRASKQTVSRWIKSILADSGVDTSKYTSHSTRHSSTSSARAAGVSLDVIRKTAGWSESSSTFAKFYNVPIIESNDNNTFIESIFNLH